MDGESMRRKSGAGLALLLGILCMPAIAWAAQTVYYNTEGGRYYHADPQCSAIDEKYWDEMAETTTAYTDRLGLRGPCSRCFEEEPALPAAMLPVKNGHAQKNAEIWCFGGSGPDEINGLSVTPQGYIVMTGYTASADGTLLHRTKSGWSGWTALVDTEGNTLWNFCSRHASRDRMRVPVVHEDGTITVLLESRGSEYDQAELIRLDMQGNVLSRRPLLRLEKGQGALAPEMPHVFEGGYVVASYDAQKRINYEPVSGSRMPIYQPLYHFFDFEGNLLHSMQVLWHTGIAAISDRHAIMAIDQTYWLCAMDEKGEHTKLVSLYEGLKENMEYRDLVSLKDGGAVAALYVHGGKTMQSTIKRWNAQGSLLSEITLEDFCVNSLQSCGDKVVVCGETAQSRDMMLVFDSNGQLIRRENVGNFCMDVVALHENAVVCAQSVGAEQSDQMYFNWDAQLCIVDIAQ